MPPSEALGLMTENKISGVPVTEKSGRLVGILTNRDVRFASNPEQKISELMTHENLVTVREAVDQEEAKRYCTAQIEKLLVVDDDYCCVGLITVKDMEKAQLHPMPPRTRRGVAGGRLPQRWVMTGLPVPQHWLMLGWT